MSRMIPKKKHLLLFLPLLLVIVVKESYASSDENHAASFLLPNAHESPRIRLSLDQSENPDENHAASFLLPNTHELPRIRLNVDQNENPDDNNGASSSSLPNIHELPRVRLTDQSEYPTLDSIFETDRMSFTEDEFTTLMPNASDNRTSSTDALKTLKDGESINETTASLSSVVISNLTGSAENSTDDSNDALIVGAVIENNQDFHTSTNENLNPNLEANGSPSFGIPSNILRKRILTSELNVDPDSSNLDKVQPGRLDSWRPLWLDQQLSSVNIKPTVRFPSITIPQNSYIESSLHPQPELVENYSILKEPVTAYYFDLSSVIPSVPVGPLYDPSHLPNIHAHNIPISVHPTAEFGKKNFQHSFQDDSIHPAIEDNFYISNNREAVAIEPTPTLPQFDDTHSHVQNHANEQDLIHNQDHIHDLVSVHEQDSAHDQDKVHKEDNAQDQHIAHEHDNIHNDHVHEPDHIPLHDLVHEEDRIHSHNHLHAQNTMHDKNQGNVSSMLSSDSATVPLLYNKTTDDLQNSTTPEYTLGNLTDFEFTQKESALSNNSTNYSDAVTLSSTLSSEKHWDSQNFTVDFTETETPMNPSFDTSYYDEYLDFEHNNTQSPSFVNDTVEEAVKPEMEPIDVNITNHIKDITHNITTLNITPVTSTTESTTTTTSTTTSSTSTTTTTTTAASTSTTTTSTTPTETTTSEVPVRKFSIPSNIPDNLEYLFPFNRSDIFNDTSDADAVPENNTTEEDISVPAVVVVSKNEGNVPVLNLVQMHKNGTNTSHPTPYIKAAIAYDLQEFCQHHENIRDLLKQWINAHLSNFSGGHTFEVEIFHQPDCETSKSHPSNPDQNNTTLYFYVKRDGEISPNTTLHYPKNPTNLEISQELDYLREKILHLELMNASSTEGLLLTEAAVGTSIVVIVVITTLLIILLIGAILAFVLIKRRRAAETMPGRRCTPAANDAYSLDSVSVFYHSLRRKSKKRASNKSLKSYLNQGFDDPNLPSRPLNFAKLTHFISDNEAIYDEFSNIPSIVPKYDEMPKGVEEKNRYANVIPVPETRILLDGSKSTPSAQYINANSIHGPKAELRYYIATQAPLDNTVADFWQMIWEQESKVIVMLTDFVEKGIDKCADYLPPSETLDCHRVYGEFQITLKSRDMREKYIVSLLQIKNLENNLVREVAHMWYTGWPQTGVPTEEKLFISFIFDVRTTRKQLRAKGPIIVHCSPGTGRTGTYIACDLCMRQFDEQKVIDIPKTVFRIRRERAGAVQTKEQYAFIYRVVNLYAAKLTTGNLDSF